MPFNIGPGELILVLVIAIIFIGPGRLPDVGAALGKSIREFRKASSDLADAARVDATPLPPADAAPQADAATPVPPSAAPAPTPEPSVPVPTASTVPAPIAAPPDPAVDDPATPKL